MEHISSSLVRSGKISFDLWLYPPLIAPVLLVLLCLATKWMETETVPETLGALWIAVLVILTFLVAGSVAASLWRIDSEMFNRATPKM